MSQIRRNIAKLGQVADLILDRELAILAEYTKKCSKIQREILDLDIALLALNARKTAGNETHPGELMRHNGNWQKWRRLRKKELTLKLAESEAIRHEKLTSARKAFGQTQAIAGLTSTQNH